MSCLGSRCIAFDSGTSPGGVHPTLTVDRYTTGIPVPYSMELEPMSIEKNVEALVERAVKADKSEDAMKFSQAALNAANAAIGLSNMARANKNR